MKILLLLTTLLFALPSGSQAQEFAEYQKQYFLSKQDTLPFRVLLPKDFDTKKKYPLLIFLHGIGERGSDNEKQLTHGARFFLKDSIRERFPAVVVFPQCPDGSSWHNAKVTPFPDGRRMVEHPKTRKSNRQLNMLADLIFEMHWVYPIDENRIYLGGLSNGGRGTLEMVRQNPKLFAAAFAICGGANPAIAPDLKNTPLWLFHGDADPVNPYRESKEVYDALKELDATVRMTTFPGTDHNAWEPAFKEPGLMEWLFSFNR